jgi:dehydrogenase/reductase SDR family protein 12
MTVLHETADVARPVDEIFAYVSDFTSTIEWDATALRAIKLTPGEIAVGTEFEVICALPVGSITLIYRVEDLQANKRIVLRGRSRFFNIQDTISFTPSTHGTKIDYRAEFFFKPFISWLGSLSKKGLERMGRESVAGLALALQDDFPPHIKKRSWREKILPELSLFTRLGYRLARKRFHPMSASVKGKHMVVTGASAGLGYVTAKELGRRGADLTLVMRDTDKAKKTVAQLQRETGNKSIRYELADLSLMADVDMLMSRLKSRGQAIDVLVNNAGALFNPRGETHEGLEQSYALLLLSPWRLTEGLKPLLLKADAPRVINVVSGG